MVINKMCRIRIVTCKDDLLYLLFQRNLQAHSQFRQNRSARIASPSPVFLGQWIGRLPQKTSQSSSYLPSIYIMPETFCIENYNFLRHPYCFSWFFSAERVPAKLFFFLVIRLFLNKFVFMQSSVFLLLLKFILNYILTVLNDTYHAEVSLFCIKIYIMESSVWHVDLILKEAQSHMCAESNVIFFFNFVLLFFIRIVVQQARNRAQNICYKNKAYV